MPQEAEALVTITRLIEGFEPAAQQRMVQYLVSKVGIPSLEGRRANDRERQHRSRDLSRDMSQAVVTNGADADLIGSSSSVSGSKKKETLLTTEGLAKAKDVLESRDYEFLAACPDPFRTQWLGDPEWWVSLRDGYPKIDALREASRYMSWEGARRKRDHKAALRNWIAKAERWRENGELRQAVRR